MLQEHEIVALTVDLPEHQLLRGDIGTIVDKPRPDQTYVVEFSDDEGVMVALAFLKPEQIRAVQKSERRLTRVVAA